MYPVGVTLVRKKPILETQPSASIDMDMKMNGSDSPDRTSSMRRFRWTALLLFDGMKSLALGGFATIGFFFVSMTMTQSSGNETLNFIAGLVVLPALLLQAVPGRSRRRALSILFARSAAGFVIWMLILIFGGLVSPESGFIGTVFWSIVLATMALSLSVFREGAFSMARQQMGGFEDLLLWAQAHRSLLLFTVWSCLGLAWEIGSYDREPARELGTTVILIVLGALAINLLRSVSMQAFLSGKAGRPELHVPNRLRWPMVFVQTLLCGMVIKHVRDSVSYAMSPNGIADTEDMSWIIASFATQWVLALFLAISFLFSLRLYIALQRGEIVRDEPGRPHTSPSSTQRRWNAVIWLGHVFPLAYYSLKFDEIPKFLKFVFDSDFRAALTRADVIRLEEFGFGVSALESFASIHLEWMLAIPLILYGQYCLLRLLSSPRDPPPIKSGVASH